MDLTVEPVPRGAEELLPSGVPDLIDAQKGIPRLAKDQRLVQEIRRSLRRLPTTHHLHRADARQMTFLKPGSAHLILTSPPYWNLKRYRDHQGQLGHLEGYAEFVAALDCVWQQCYDALVPGGRLVCVVGDVCLSRRNNNGRHTVVPLHATIQEHCRVMGFDNLAPIIWHKIANATYEVEGRGAFLGKPYEPNGVVKNDIEFILMQRKPGGYRRPALATRLLSVISAEEHRQWYQQIWSGLPGASTRRHPAPYPVELAERLIRMFSFVGDTVLDPFSGSGTTAVAAARAGRNSVCSEVDPVYFANALERVRDESAELFADVRVVPFGPDLEVA